MRPAIDFIRFRDSAFCSTFKVVCGLPKCIQNNSLRVVPSVREKSIVILAGVINQQGLAHAATRGGVVPIACRTQGLPEFYPPTNIASFRPNHCRWLGSCDLRPRLQLKVDRVRYELPGLCQDDRVSVHRGLGRESGSFLVCGFAWSIESRAWKKASL